MVLFPLILAAGILVVFGFAAGFHSRRRCRFSKSLICLTPPTSCVALAGGILVSPVWVAQLQRCGILGSHDLLSLHVLAEFITVFGALVIGPLWGWTIAQIL